MAINLKSEWIVIRHRAIGRVAQPGAESAGSAARAAEPSRTGTRAAESTGTGKAWHGRTGAGRKEAGDEDPGRETPETQTPEAKTPAPAAKTVKKATTGEGKTVEEIIARVNNEIITKSELDKARNAAEEDARQECANRCTPEQLQVAIEDGQKYLLCAI